VQPEGLAYCAGRVCMAGDAHELPALRQGPGALSADTPTPPRRAQFTDTIYLPALSAIREDLNTTDSMTTASVGIYMLFIGLGSLVWGPAADRFGRRATYLASAALFLATTIACIFSPNIVFLLVFRALQGLAVAAYLSTGVAPREDGQLVCCWWGSHQRCWGCC
jgi:MFS family permease